MLSLILIALVISLLSIISIEGRRILQSSSNTHIKSYNNEHNEHEKYNNIVHGNNTDKNTSSIRRRLFTDAKVPNDHKVTNLPGLTGNADLVHYAGHLLVDKQKQGYIFYWLFERPKNPETAPLLLWVLSLLLLLLI